VVQVVQELQPVVTLHIRLFSYGCRNRAALDPPVSSTQIIPSIFSFFWTKSEVWSKRHAEDHSATVGAWLGPVKRLADRDGPAGADARGYRHADRGQKQHQALSRGSLRTSQAAMETASASGLREERRPPWRRRTGYLAAARDLAGSGTTPSWRIRPRASQLTKPSTILPFEKRAMVTPVIANCFPVGAMPLSSPL
jgi:hypothetical protein